MSQYKSVVPNMFAGSWLWGSNPPDDVLDTCFHGPEKYKICWFVAYYPWRANGQPLLLSTLGSTTGTLHIPLQGAVAVGKITQGPPHPLAPPHTHTRNKNKWECLGRCRAYCLTCLAVLCFMGLFWPHMGFIIWSCLGPLKVFYSVWACVYACKIPMGHLWSRS